ncbi:hypothetical protein CRUP_019975 [Coryphaenoides rupestris]|nr:hypothetical protein CRUP_019975 [Coryphaenoides rupestris]
MQPLAGVSSATATSSSTATTHSTTPRRSCVVHQDASSPGEKSAESAGGRSAPISLSSAPHCRDFMEAHSRAPPPPISGAPVVVPSSSACFSSASSSSSSSTPSSAYPPPAAPPAPPPPPPPLREAPSRSSEGPKDKQEAPDAEYLTSRCVLFTYYHGDISSVAPISLSSAPHCRDFMEAHSRAPPPPISGAPVVVPSSSACFSSASSSSSSSTPSSAYPPPAAPPAPPPPPPPLREAPSRSSEGPKDKQEAPDAEYLTSRCVLFTYYHGGHQQREAPSPSSRRSFPPSFWDSNYSPPQPRSHCEVGAYSMDPYASGGLRPGLAHPHPHGWGYAQSQAYGPPRPLHELYSPAAALEPHYGPLLMPAVRPPHLSTLPGPYDVSKLEASPSWPGLLPPGDVSQTLALNMDAGLQHHKKGKELYWF